MLTFYAYSVNSDGLYEDKRHVDGIYLDGLLERLNHFDLVAADEDVFNYLDTHDSIVEDVKLYLATGKEIKAKLYFWKVDWAIGYRKRYRGLICLPDDCESIRKAEESYSIEKKFL